MPIVIWKNAILIYKKARYVVPIALAAAGYVLHWVQSKVTKRCKRNK